MLPVLCNPETGDLQLFRSKGMVPALVPHDIHRLFVTSLALNTCQSPLPQPGPGSRSLKVTQLRFPRSHAAASALTSRVMAT